MKRLVVQENADGWWEVLEVDVGREPLYRGDRLWAEGFARRHCQATGGTISVVSPTEGQLAEYAVKPPGQPPGRP